MDDSCREAISKAGGPVAMARQLGAISSQAISQWKRIPGDRVLDVERITGISRHVLRPDIFGAETEAGVRP